MAVEAKPQIQGYRLDEHAMLVTLNLKKWSNSKHNKKVSAEVANQHGADQKMGRYTNKLINPEPLKEINSIDSQIRMEFYRRTLPWTDEGTRILSCSGYMDFVDAMRRLSNQRKAAIAEFAKMFPTYVSDAQTFLGSLFDSQNYPSQQEILGKFEFTWAPIPMPTAENFIAKLAENEVEMIRQNIESNRDDAMKGAVNDVLERMVELAEKMAEKLENYSKTEQENGKTKVENSFKDTLVTNLKDLLTLVPSLNITNDPKISEFASRMTNELCRYDGETLRNSDDVRLNTAKAAKSIVEELKGLL